LETRKGTKINTKLVDRLTRVEEYRKNGEKDIKPGASLKSCRTSEKTAQENAMQGDSKGKLSLIAWVAKNRRGATRTTIHLLRRLFMKGKCGERKKREKRHKKKLGYWKGQ